MRWRYPCLHPCYHFPCQMTMLIGNKCLFFNSIFKTVFFETVKKYKLNKDEATLLLLLNREDNICRHYNVDLDSLKSIDKKKVDMANRFLKEKVFEVERLSRRDRP